MNIIVKSRCIFDGKRKTPYAGYVKIKEDRIEAVVEADGLPENIQDYRVIDCGDKTIMAGFCDAHVHLYLGAMESATVNVFYSANEEEAAAALYDFYKDDEGPWVIGFGWSHYRWPGEKLPTKESLDRLFPDRPVVVFNDELHGIWVNSKALALCGITKNSPEPKGGLIKRDEEGNPTGYLLEVPAMRLITEKALNMTEDFEEKMLRSFTQKAYQRGVTSVGDVQILNMVKPKVYEKMIEKGALGVRVMFAPEIELEISEAQRLSETYHSDRLKFIGLKGFLDGTPLGYTGLLVEEYTQQPGQFGKLLMDETWLQEKADSCYAHGISLRLHACGDGAVRTALDVFEAAQKKQGKEACEKVRNTIEHIELIHPADMGRFEKTGTIASIQPGHMIMESLEQHPIFQIVGEARAKLSWPGKSLERAGAKVAFSTDYPIVDLNPFDTLYRATMRVMEDDLPEGGWNPEEKFSLAEALNNTTINAAYLLQMEDKVGSLEEGKLADLVVLDCNLFTLGNENLLKARVEKTIFAGEVVYTRD